MKKTKEISQDKMTVTNTAPDKTYRNFDEFFNQYALVNGVNLRWKDSVKKHLSSLGWLKNQELWAKGIKHFGL